MRRLGLVLFLAFGFSAHFSLAKSPETPEPVERFSDAALSSRDHGARVLSAAWQHRRLFGRRRPDCSHLVHEIYSLAGLEYPYVPSIDLYQGMEPFVRVAGAQHGDLIVWRSHVGIVVDPGARSFYSSTRSGLRIDFYDSDYWRRHGKPRFYRYLLPNRVLLQAAQRPGGPKGNVADDPTAERRTMAAKVEAEGYPAPTVSPPDTTSIVATAPRLPAVILLTSDRNLSRREVEEGVLRHSEAMTTVLTANTTPPFMGRILIFESLRVEKPKLKGNRGSVEARFGSVVTFKDRRVEQKQRNEKVRLKLQHGPEGWLLNFPQDRAYVSSSAAVSFLATQLAQRAAANRSKHEQQDLANLLVLLLEK
jgi:hypothetical protein